MDAHRPVLCPLGVNGGEFPHWSVGQHHRPTFEIDEGALPIGIAQFDLAGVRFPARLGSVEEVAAHLRAFVAIGFEHLTVNVVDPPGARGIERFGAVIEALRR